MDNTELRENMVTETQKAWLAGIINEIMSIFSKSVETQSNGSCLPQDEDIVRANE